MRKLVVVLGLFLVAGFAISKIPDTQSSAIIWRIGQPATIKADTIGCPDPAALDKMLELKRQHDDAAFQTYLMGKLVSGACKGFTDHETQAIVVRLSNNNRVQARPLGDPDEYWFPAFAVTQAQDQ